MFAIRSQAVAQWISDTLYEAHRGAVAVCDGEVAIFGNDAYFDDERTRVEVEVVRRMLRERGIEVEAFAIGSNGHTWAIIVRHNDWASLLDLVWTAWREAWGVVGFHTGELAQKELGMELCARTNMPGDLIEETDVEKSIRSRAREAANRASVAEWKRSIGWSLNRKSSRK